MSGRRAVFLDRDGVLVRDDGFHADPGRLRLFEDAAAAVSRLRGLGFLVVVVTNQPVVARGLASEEDVRRVNSRLAQILEAAGAPIDAFRMCPHHPDATLPAYRQDCPCRKPAPGMLLDAAAELGIDLGKSFMVGDRPTDTLAGQRAGCRTVLVQTGRHADPPIRTSSPVDASEPPDHTCAGLGEAAAFIAENVEMRALVLAAGYGTRLGALGEATPKVLLDVGGEPLVAHTLRLLALHGFGDVALNLHFRPERIRDAVGDGTRYGVKVRYSHEETPLGTAGALRPLAAFLGGAKEFLVVYGDLLTDQDLSALVRAHRARRAFATLLVHRRAGSNSLVRLAPDGRITGFVERPDDAERAAFGEGWVNSGIQVLSSRAIALIPEGRPSDLPRDLYVPLAATEPIYGLPITGHRIAIDSPERYAEAVAFAERGVIGR